MCDPLKPPEMPPVVLRCELYWAMSIPKRIRRHVPNVVPSSPVVWQFSHTFECVPLLKPPNARWDIEGRIVFNLCRFPYESADVYQIWCQSVQLFDSFPDFWICDPLHSPGVLRGNLYLAYVHSRTNPQICTKVGANRSCRLTASPNICDTLKNPKLPWGIVVRIVFSRCPFPDESADVYQIRGLSVQPFDSFPRLFELATPYPPNAP